MTATAIVTETVPATSSLPQRIKASASGCTSIYTAWIHGLPVLENHRAAAGALRSISPILAAAPPFSCYLTAYLPSGDYCHVPAPSTDADVTRPRDSDIIPSLLKNPLKD